MYPNWSDPYLLYKFQGVWDEWKKERKWKKGKKGVKRHAVRVLYMLCFLLTLKIFENYNMTQTYQIYKQPHKNIIITNQSLIISFYTPQAGA